MNNKKIGFQGQIQPSNGVIGNGVVELVSQGSQFVNVRPWNLGICLGIGAGRNSQPQNSVPVNLSSPIINCLDAHVPGLYAAERCVDLPYDHQTSSPTFSPKSYDSEYQLNPCSADVFSVSVSEQDGSDFPSGSLLQSAVKSFLYGDQNQFYASEKSHSRLLADLACSGGKQDFRFMFCSQQEKLEPRPVGIIPLNSGNSISSGTAVSSKTRIRWTPELHEKFVECVNRLGGANKATPKAILKLMDSDGLTIFHVKSHLQKYRMAKYVPDSSEGKSERRSLGDVTQIEIKTGIKLKEALQLQLDVQRRLYEQLEIQRNLQMRIEEQGRQLEIMLDQQQKTRQALYGNQNSGHLTCPDGPSLSLDDVQVSSEEESGNNFHPR